MQVAKERFVSPQTGSGSAGPPLLWAVLCVILAGCATTPKDVSKAESDRSLAWLQSLFPGKKLPVSARNVHAHSEYGPGTSLLYGRFDVRTGELEQVLARTDRLPPYCQLFESADSHEKRYMMAQTSPLKNCSWWTPGEANRFGSITILKHWRDRLDNETRTRKFHAASTYCAALQDAGNGNGIFFILAVSVEPEQEE
jgi:hypothetical protein